MVRLIELALVCAMTLPASAADTVQIKNLKVLCVIYRGDPAAENHMDDHAVTQAKNGVELARLFYFRNSRAKLNCELHWIVADQAPPKTEGPTMENIEVDLKSRGVKPGEYDGLFVTGVGLAGNWGGFTVLGGAGGCFGGHSVRGKLGWYPQDNPDVAYGTAWNFTHEFQHALDLVIAENSGRPDMLHAHPYDGRHPPTFKGFYQGGEHFDWIALTLREFENWMNIKGVTNSVLDCTDADGDGLPDDDPRLPMDEKRLGSKPTEKDTDRDGLDDLGEFIADRYAGSDPNKTDTDGDRLRDGDDPYPLVAISPTLPYHRGGKAKLPILIQSVFVRNDEGGAVAIRGSWNEDELYFELLGPRKFSVLCKIDGSARNGFWEGGDTYLLRIHEGGADFAGLGLSGPCPDAKITYKFENFSDNPMYDGAVPVGYKLAVRIPARLGQGVSKEINYGGEREPRDVVDGLTLVEGRSIGLNFIYEFADGTRAALTPHHTMYATRLVKPASALEYVVLRGPAQTSAAIVGVEVLGARDTNRVDVVTDDGRVVGSRIGSGPANLVGLDQDGNYTLNARTSESWSPPHRLRVDRTSPPPVLKVEKAALLAECEPNAEFELWWGLDGIPVAPLGGAQADVSGTVSLPLGDDLAKGWVVTGYRGSRFDELVFIESWQNIDKHFKGGPADPRLPADHFSYRFEGLLEIEKPGRYTLELTSDDGARLWLDDEPIIDHWGHHGLSPKSATLNLDAGLHRARIDYYEEDGWAGIKLRFAQEGRELTTAVLVRRLPVDTGEIDLFGVQTDSLGNRSGFGTVSKTSVGKEEE